MAPKRKPTPDNPNHPKAKKQKLDWSTIQGFRGFTVTAANAKAQKKRRDAAAAAAAAAAADKHKTATTGKPPKYPGQDAPLDANVVQSNPFPQTNLSQVHVKISPVLHWESTSRYRKFTINGEEFQVAQIVFVKNSEESDVKNPPDAVEGWLAKILEIRAGDSSHVFLRVFWVYRPEDLPGGRQPHHGSSEVIVSNHMDVIEAVTVQSLADIVHWNDDPDSLPLSADQLFFRQSYDVTKRLHPFSALKKYCIDQQPINPDELLVQCSHCSEWLHARCLEQEAVRKVSEPHQPTPPLLNQNNKRPKANDNSGPELRFSAKLSASDTGKVRLTVTDSRLSEDRTLQRDVDVFCLMCGKVIERAHDSLSFTHLETLSGVAEEDESENVTVSVTITTKDALPNDAAAAVTKLEPAPLAPVGTNAPRKRGRPPGSKIKRKRLSASLAKKPNQPKANHFAILNTSNKGHVAPPTIATTTTHTWPTTNALTTTAAIAMAPSVSASTKATNTPQSTPVQHSLLQSSVRSVKRLLWRE